MSEINAKRIERIQQYLGISNIVNVNPQGSSTCPACGKKNKFSVWDDRLARCWSNTCSLNPEANGKPFSKFNIVSLYQELNNLQGGRGFYKALEELEAKVGINHKSSTQITNERASFLEDCLNCYSWLLWSPQGKEARDYLFSRGFTEEVIKTEEIGFAPNPYCLRGYQIDSNKLREEGLLRYSKEYFDNRIIFPIRDISGNLVHFTGRYLGDVPLDEYGEEALPRYKDTKAVRDLPGTKAYLAFENKLPGYSSTLYLAEGYPDALSLIQRGLPAAGLLGLEKIENHKTKLKSFSEIIAVFDNDTYSKDHPKYPLEYKSWRRVIPQLINLQLSLPQSKIYIWIVPEKGNLNKRRTKDINDWLSNSSYTQEEILSIISSNKKSLTNYLIDNWGDDLSKHKTLIELISCTKEGKDKLERYIPFNNPIDYALEILNAH